MKRITSFMFLAIFFLLIFPASFSVAANAQPGKTRNQPRDSRKADRKQRKAMKKYAKAQKKAQRKMVKKDRKNTHYPPRSF